MNYILLSVTSYLLVVSGLFVKNSWANNRDYEERLLSNVTTWAEKLGREFWEFGIVVTRRKTVIESYKQANIEIKDGDNLTNEIAAKVKTMMEQKVAAVERIMENAGNLAVSSSDAVDEDFDYYNAKNLTNNLTDPDTGERRYEYGNAEALKLRNKRFLKPSLDDDFQRDEELEEEVSEDGDDGEPQSEAKRVLQVTDGEDVPQASQQGAKNNTPKINYRKLNLTENPNFFNIPVNTEHSAVHVPSNVYDRSTEVISGIKWSADLDRIFLNNYRDDPTLSWQYFGSSTGFMRQFPAMIWRQEPVDMFDCRTRSWFIEAASSPKDIVVLVDKSGSMTGMSKEIAKHVVNNILDTLGNNDYVNIFTFSNVTEPLIDCFNDTLVQANLGNVRALKEEMDNKEKFKTENIANFSNALTVAFELLHNYRVGSRNKSGAGCNQAIMLVTDGLQYNYKEIFQKYNWYSGINNTTQVNVRIFTYLIGREVPDVREIKWMACANQGYYVHLSTFAEVREQVLQYIPVMARPMVLKGDKPQPTWSPVYADVADPKLTNWLWVQRLRRDQRDKILDAQRHKKNRHTVEQDKKYVHQQKRNQDHYGDLQTYTLMTSVSMPVYDRRQNATKVANLLGVAGTDVPIHYIQQLMMPHLLGVNAYAFIITNNGYILIHPDLRPVFQGILKPAYNRVDMVEIELPDDANEPREFNKSLLEMRREIIKQHKSKTVMDTKYHIDDMKRVIRGKRHFHYIGIDGTPFTLVVTLPDKYGTMKIQPPGFKEDIHRMVANDKQFTKFFAGDKWKIHPDWIYCRYLNGKKNFSTHEDELMDFLKRMEHEHWRWAHPKPNPTEQCDRSLVQSLVYDAKVTKWFDQNISQSRDENRDELIKRFGITVAFLATHSGLTRWQDFPQNFENMSQPLLHFSDLHKKAIDEIWYKRAVEQHYIEEESFVYSVPFDAGDDRETLVTASNAVFLDSAGRKAPAAVVGFQFYRTQFYEYFKNSTNHCDQNCVNDECISLTCYVLDNNAYVVLSFEPVDTGRWFGDIRPGIMKMLIQERVYKSVRMYDYQAVCFPVEGGETNDASMFLSPFKIFYYSFQYFLTSFLYFMDLLSAVSSNNDYDVTVEPMYMTEAPQPKSNEKEFNKSLLINKTKPTPCDTERWLYELHHHKGPKGNPFNKRMENCTRPFIAQRIPYSNLILLVIRTTCKNEEYSGVELLTPHAEEVDYNQSLACRIREDDLFRRRYAKCINRHDNESQITLCGRSSMTLPSITLIILSISSILVNRWQ